MHAIHRPLDRTGPAARFARTVAGATMGAFVATGAHAGAPTTAPQVLLAITNSESMDGTTAGAIMTGSGSLGSGYATLNGSSSPTNYVIPAGFTPPVNTGTAGSAPYTANCLTNSSYKCDNSQSRLNMTKAAIQQVLTSYGNSLNFGLYEYANASGGAPSASLYSTWVYYMSPSSSGFTFTNTASSTTVNNPCFGYATATTNVNTACNSIATAPASPATGISATTLSTNKYINIGANSDDPQINDVLYAGSSLPAELLTYGTVSPANPYTAYGLSTYNTNIGGYAMKYSNTAPNIGAWSTTPTNAGYVPFSPQVLYSARGFGYGGSQSPTTGYPVVAMGSDPSSGFTAALNPETNNASTAEIKSFAGQSGIYALMNGAKTYLSGLHPAACQPQYVVLLTDGLPTMDKNGSAWPPLGTTTATAYSLTATYNTDGSFASSNSQAVTDAIASIAALQAAGIKVYVIGLGAGVDPTVNAQAAKLLTAMAIAGGTSSYFAAGDSTSLNNAFLTIIDQIYSENSLSAPVAPISVASGTALEYELTSVPTPVAGHVKAYPVAADGTQSTTASWDAASLMNASNRTTALMGPKTDGTFGTLATLDAAVWNLTVTTCVPTTATIISYTINPSVTGTCSYLAGRESGWFLGNFSTQNTGRYVGPPASATLGQSYSSYTSYARSSSGRTPMLMFTNDDGFLYALTASTGALRWGWSSRPLLAKMQNYSTFQGTNATDGNFAVVDAMDGGGVWASYVVGSFQSGSEHFSFKLDGTGAPLRMVYDNVVTNGTSAGDLAGATGNTPLRQPPVVAYIGNSAYAVYVVTVGTTSTLYESNVATGTTTSGALSTQISSHLWLDANTNQLWMGAANGGIYRVSLATGNAATDAATASRAATMVNPATGATVTNPLYVGYTEVRAAPHLFVVSATELEVFNVTATGWTPEWATTTTTGYKYTPSSSTWSTVSGANTLTANSVASDIPLLIGSAILVPVYVAGSGCSQGTGYYDIFSLDSPSFPSDLVMTQNGNRVTGNYMVGSGPAFTPSVTFATSSVVINNGSRGCTVNCKDATMPAKYQFTPFSWRQH